MHAHAVQKLLNYILQAVFVVDCEVKVLPGALLDVFFFVLLKQLPPPLRILLLLLEHQYLIPDHGRAVELQEDLELQNRLIE